MKLDATTVQVLFATVEIVLGVVSLLTGKITFSAGEGSNNSDDSDTDIVGGPAKILSVALIITGVVTYFHAATGFTLLVLALVIGYIFARRASV